MDEKFISIISNIYAVVASQTSECAKTEAAEKLIKFRPDHSSLNIISQYLSDIKLPHNIWDLIETEELNIFIHWQIDQKNENNPIVKEAKKEIERRSCNQCTFLPGYPYAKIVCYQLPETIEKIPKEINCDYYEDDNHCL